MGILDYAAQEDRKLLGMMLMRDAFQGMANPNAQRSPMETLMGYRQMKQAQGEEEDRKFLRDTAARHYQSPAQQALAAGGQGPTNEAAAQMQNFKPQFDTEGFIGAVMARDPLLGMNMRKTLAGEQPKMHLVDVEDPARPGRTVKRWVREGEANGVDVGTVPQKLPDGMRIGPDGLPQIDPVYLQMKTQIAAAGRAPAQAPQPYFQFLPTANGYAVGNARTGQVAPVSIGGAPVMRATDSPQLQGNIAQAKAAGQTLGESNATAQIDAPRVIQNAETALRLSDELLAHKGFEQAVGASSMLGVQNIPGTAARDFVNRLDQVKGSAFLEAFQMLKGGGAITETEGKKASDAIARMNISTSESEFRAAARDYQAVIRIGMERARKRAQAGGGSAPVPTPATAGQAPRPALDSFFR